MRKKANCIVAAAMAAVCITVFGSCASSPGEVSSQEPGTPASPAPESPPPESRPEATPLPEEWKKANFGQADDATYIEGAFTAREGMYTPSVNTISFPVFFVEFQDAKFTDALLPSQETLRQWIFSAEDSVAAYYYTASYGRLLMTGDVYFYTAKGKIGEYESYMANDQLVKEALEYFGDEVDFSKYDQNGDSVMDCLILTVPTGGTASFWWANAATWESTAYKADGVYVKRYLVNDIQPYSSSRSYFLETLEHELGHCMGLPDYYKYKYEGSDFQGLHGAAGTEMMDDSKGDFCQFSKLQMGWLTEEQVQIMPSDVDRASFTLPPASEGGCVLVFPKGKEPDFQSEYFVIEYNTPDRLQFQMAAAGSGVRVMHAQGELLEYGNNYKYSNFSQFYDSSNNGIRILKLVNDGNGFFREGDIITYESTGAEKGNFGWYTEDEQITAPGFRIEIGRLTEDGASIEIVWED